MGGVVFVCAMLGEMWDLGGLTLDFLVAWSLRKWGKSGEIGIFGLLWVFSDLVSRRKLKYLLNYVV